MPPPLIARGLHKHYGTVRALDGFDLEIAPGSVHGLLGPNGAGKSTAVHTFATLVRCEAGEARIAGHDLRRDPAAVRRSIGLVGQQAAVDEILHGRENLVMFGLLHGLSRRTARARASELLELFGLAEAAERKVSTYSGGMRRRLDIAASLIRRPALLFLDEPTTGLDPRARNEVWRAVRDVVELGTTVLLTTQYLDEADQLADRVTVMRAGRVVAEGSPEELKSRIGGDRIIVDLPPQPGDAPAGLVARLDAQVSGTVAHDRDTGRLTVEAEPAAGTVALLALVRALDATGLTPGEITLRRPTLDEVFLSLTDTSTTHTHPDSTADSSDGGPR